ncbi:14861_t:CDS:1 [Acaulospora colombiana]|uniref:14861_t:CDS:1 n=1 Tax=Acaulospora colombiana TaxID=27376 RepID=A0ACA9N091_9GLOM|nr:14861_t:CDS:1 [Acaulospora colombiana]
MEGKNNLIYSPLSTFLPGGSVKEKSDHNDDPDFSSTISTTKRNKVCIRCDPKIRIGLMFPIIFAFIYLLHLLYLEYLTNDVEGNRSDGDEIKIEITIVDILPERPYEGYVLDMGRINEHCEPTDYKKSALKRFPVQSCLDYLDTRQYDYMVNPPINSTTSAATDNVTTTNTSSSILTSNLQCAPGREPMLFHVYWRGKFTDKIALNIKSFLYTQPLRCSKMLVWLEKNDEDLRANKHAKSLLRFSPTNIEFRKWDITEQLNYDSIYSGWERKLKSKTKVVSYSDTVRFVLLHRYGGIYVDADTIFLRDMSPLYYLDYEFSYRWSFKFDYNTAVLRIRPNSTTSRKIINGAMKNSMKFHPFAIKKYLFADEKDQTKEVLDKQLYMMPVALFDPLWLKSDLHVKSQKLKPNLARWNDVFSAGLLNNEFPGANKELLAKAANDTTLLRKNDEFFRGAFTYHWHNLWKQRIANGSWFDVLQKGYDDFIEGKIRNPYNESITDYT